MRCPTAPARRCACAAQATAPATGRRNLLAMLAGAASLRAHQAQAYGGRKVIESMSDGAPRLLAGHSWTVGTLAASGFDTPHASSETPIRESVQAKIRSGKSCKASNRPRASSLSRHRCRRVGARRAAPATPRVNSSARSSWVQRRSDPQGVVAMGIDVTQTHAAAISAAMLSCRWTLIPALMKLRVISRQT